MHMAILAAGGFESQGLSISVLGPTRVTGELWIVLHDI